MEQLAKLTAELALRLAALPADRLGNDSQMLDAIEQLANRVLKEVSVARSGSRLAIGETRGMWRPVQPAPRQ